MGLNDLRVYCKHIIDECKIFLHEQLKLSLDIDKIKTIYSHSNSALFLGYCIYRTKLSKMKISYTIKDKRRCRTTDIIVGSCIDSIMLKLNEQGFSKKNGLPTRNERFINHTLYDIIEHYKIMEKGILQYCKIANNYGRVASKVHYILKHSCALTIAFKMKLKSLRRVF